MYVQLLVKMLKRTIKFEEELEKYYSKVSLVQTYYEGDPENFEEPSDADVIRKKYKEAEKAKSGIQTFGEEELSDRQKALLNDQQSLFFKGIISKAFAAFMSQYVVLERNNIAQLVEKISKEENWTIFESKSSGGRKEDPRLPSSDNLFLYFRRSLQECQKLDSKDLLFDIVGVRYTYIF
jgi:hypothetical protein